jgi:hypothetical protein
VLASQGRISAYDPLTPITTPPNNANGHRAIGSFYASRRTLDFISLFVLYQKVLIMLHLRSLFSPMKGNSHAA